MSNVARESPPPTFYVAVLQDGGTFREATGEEVAAAYKPEDPRSAPNLRLYLSKTAFAALVVECLKEKRPSFKDTARPKYATQLWNYLTITMRDTDGTDVRCRAGHNQSNQNGTKQCFCDSGKIKTKSRNHELDRSPFSPRTAGGPEQLLIAVSSVKAFCMQVQAQAVKNLTNNGDKVQRSYGMNQYTTDLQLPVIQAIVERGCVPAPQEQSMD